MAATKPAIALVTGAWHSPVHYANFLSILGSADFETKSIQLPSVGSDNAKAQSVTEDSKAIRKQLLLPLIEAGKDVILMMHSYGGCPGAAAATGLGKRERASKGGIVGLVFITAFLAQEGMSLKGSLPGAQLDPWVKIDEESGQTTVEGPTNVFYYDLPADKEVQAIKDLQNHSLNALCSPSPPPAWPSEIYKGRRGYIRAMEDHCIPTVAQEMMVKYSGVDWDVKEIEGGHSPFLSRPEELAEIVERMIAGFEVV